jgi:glycosyltransferase involved in cell wall biosynthesis
MSRISVIVICKNAAATIERALDSIRIQSHKPSEVLVVAAPSDDETLTILESRTDLVILKQPGYGIADARNYGISMARERYIAFLDADDEWTPDALEVQLAVLASDPTAMVAMGFLVKVGQDSETLSDPMPAATPGGCLYRAEVFSVVGGFATDVTVASDHKWFMRARLEGVKQVSHEKIILKKYIHGKNESVVRRHHYRMEFISLLRGRT